MTAGLIHHIEFYVDDLERSKAFWGWLLGSFGYVVHQEWPQGISWRLGATYLVFVQVAERFREPPYHRCRVGLNHLAFHARSRAHVDELEKELRARKVNVLYPERKKEPYAVYFEDPDRIKVEVVAP